nr:uncharacterized protein LOC127072014 isoform X2 [Vespula vulgaris]XP_050867962.1 uncharacterized protein LOC127072014 isoform X2 [Vespula vulgaris]
MAAHVRGLWYENRGKCCWKEKCYPKTIASKYLIKNNNAVNMRTRRSFYSKKQTKFLDLTVRNEKVYSCKCCWYKSINGTCIKHKSNKIKRQKCIRVSKDTVADLWKIQRVCDMIKSQNNVGRFQDESVNIEKLVQEETTSSSYVDAKNCFVQDAYTQSACKNKEKEIDEFRKSDEENESFNHKNKINVKNQTISNENSTDLSFNFYKAAEKIQDKYEKISLNYDFEWRKSVNVETSTSLEKENKSSTIVTCSVSKNDTDLPYIPELELKEVCDCNPTCNCEYQFSAERFGDDDIEEKNKLEIWRKYNRETIPNRSKQNRMLETRNQGHWNSDITNPSYCVENNRHVYNELRSSTSTESLIYPQAQMKITRTSSHDRGYSLFLKRLERIKKDPRRRKDNSVFPLIRRINVKEDYSDRDYSDQSLCRCQRFHRDIKPKMIIEDKFEDTETSRSKASSSSTSLSSNDYNKSARSFLYDNDCKCRYLSTVTSSTSTCTCTSTDLQSEVEYKGIEKESSKIHYPLNPLSSTITYNDNNNNYYNNNNKNSIRHFNVMRSYCQKTLSLMNRRLQNREKWINDHIL